MILNPAIIALIFGSFLISIFALHSSVIGVQIIRRWDIQSGSELQLKLERKTYLISTIFMCLLGFELFSLFLFIHTADQLHVQFLGAMCAAGSLAVNDYGYPCLILKLINFILCGIWIFINIVDYRGYDYPLIKIKYKLLLLLTGFLLLEFVLQTSYFLHARADVITSCCGALFSDGEEGLAAELAGLPSYESKVVFYLSIVLTFATGIRFVRTGRGAAVFSSMAAWLTVFSIASVISFISLYFYELPTHHCPFCLLQEEYHGVGYPLYLFLFAGGIMGMSVGIIHHLKADTSLETNISPFLNKLCLASMSAFLVFVLLASYPIVFSDFKLEGY